MKALEREREREIERSDLSDYQNARRNTTKKIVVKEGGSIQ